MIASIPNPSLADRMVGAALLDPETYNEAALSPEVKTHSALVVLLTCVAIGLGSLTGGLTGFVLGFALGLLGWVSYAVAACYVAYKRYDVPRHVDIWYATWRALGLASVPRLFLVLAFIPGIGFLLGLAVHAWVVITSTFALRASMDLEPKPAVTTAAMSVAPMLLLWVILAFVV